MTYITNTNSQLGLHNQFVIRTHIQIVTHPQEVVVVFVVKFCFVLVWFCFALLCFLCGSG